MLATTGDGMMSPEEPRTRSAEEGLGAEAEALTEIGALARRIEEGEKELAKVRSQRAATLVVLIAGSASVIVCGFRRYLEAGLFGIALAVGALLLLVGLNGWRISRDSERERELEAELDGYRDRKAQLEALQREEE